MTDHDLSRLKELPVPSPREGSKATAVNAALEAYSLSRGRLANVKPVSALFEKAQGSFALGRPTDASATAGRSKSMRYRLPMAIAATVAAVSIAVPVTLHLTKGTTSSLFGQLSQEPSSPPPLIDEQRRMEQVQVAQPRPASAPISFAAVPASTATHQLYDRSPLSYAEKSAPRATGRVANISDGRPRDITVPATIEQGRDRFEQAPSNPVKSVSSEPVSTFSIDVDTASYAFVRRALNAGRLPQKDAVRVEEMINYFPYGYPLPEDRTAPFKPTVTVLPSPWNPSNKLVHIAIKGYDIARAERPRANLVLLIDTSGSMAPENRLPLLKNAFRMLVDTLQSDDTVGVVTYAGQAQVALEPTKIAEKHKIVEAIDRLQADGSTAGAAGIQQAYLMAEAGFDKAAVNRVILGTDGDFNVGITNQAELKGFIERKRETGIYLSILGVGHDTYNDALMQALAQNGNGVAAYVDTLNEARKVLVDEASSLLFPIAKDVKIQVEFNPTRVAEYRLIGYETRLLRHEDFSNDKVDGGDIGSGHAVTAIYEITPVGSAKLVEDLRYAQPAATPTVGPQNGKGEEYAFLKIRYKLPKEEKSRLIDLPITQAFEKLAIGEVPTDVRFSIAVAGFAQLLRSEPHLKAFGYDEVIALAAVARGDDPFGYRAEFVSLARLAKTARP
jgi:Ca-activated chloride channel family protein